MSDEIENIEVKNRMKDMEQKAYLQLSDLCTTNDCDLFFDDHQGYNCKECKVKQAIDLLVGDLNER